MLGAEGWPTLANGALVDGDLKVTADYRLVLKEILSKRCRVSAGDLSSIFPGLPSGSLDIVSQKA